MFTRCVTTNEKDGVSKDDKNFKVTFNYEFLEDDRDPKHYLLGRSFTKTFSRYAHNNLWSIIFYDATSAIQVNLVHLIFTNCSVCEITKIIVN